MKDGAANRWEVGSEFHYLNIRPAVVEARPWPAFSALFSTGRGALQALVRMLMNDGARRILLPSYYCRDVTLAICDLGVELVFYRDSPVLAAPEIDSSKIRDGDIVVRVNYFGLRNLEAPPSSWAGKVIVVDDHSHDPLSDSARAGAADYCFASLRKIAPIPDGAAVWSYRELPIPNSESGSEWGNPAAARKLEAMVLKALYLAGHNVDKEEYLGIFRSAEGDLGGVGESRALAISRRMLDCMALEEWRALRRKNFETLSHELERSSGFSVFRPSVGTCPFSVILVFDEPAVCARVREELIDRSIYPAVLWPMSYGDPGVNEAEIDESKRILSLACDARYSIEDMKSVAHVVNAINRKLS